AARPEFQLEDALFELSDGLTTTHTIDGVVARVAEVLGHTIYPEQANVFMRDGNGRLQAVGPSTAKSLDFVVPFELVGRLERGDILARSEWETESGRLILPFWKRLGAELIVPIRARGSVVALLVLWPKASGDGYDDADIAFMRTAANQIALAVT